MYKGRIARLAYFLGLVYLFLPLLVLMVLAIGLPALFKGAQGGSSAGSAITAIVFLLGAVWLVFYLIAGFGLIIRRWHDLNQSGWLALLQLVPFVSLVCALIQLFAPGTKGPNSYGDQANTSLNFKTVVFGGPAGATAAPAPAQPVASAPAAPEPTPPSSAPVQPTPPAPPTPPPAPAPAEPADTTQPPSQ